MKSLVGDPFLRDLDDETLRVVEARREAWGLSLADFYPMLDSWFANFVTRDKSLALKLLLHIDYLSPETFARRLRDLWMQVRQFLHQGRRSLADLLLVVPDDRGDSADRHAYDLIKTCGLEQRQVVTVSDLEHQPSGRILVFFNDTHGTGNQFVRDLVAKVAIERFQAIFILALAIGEKALRRFKSELPHARILPDRATRGVGDLFTGNEVRRLLELGRRVYPSHPLGYGDAGLVTAYYFQCPNNSLPLIWADGRNNTVDGDAYPWSPLRAYIPKARRPPPASKVTTIEAPSPTDLDPTGRWQWSDGERARLIEHIAAWRLATPSFYRHVGEWFDNFLPDERTLALEVFLAVSYLDIRAVRTAIRGLRDIVENDIAVAGGDVSDVLLVTTGDHKDSVYHYVFDFLREWRLEVDQVRNIERLSPDAVIDRTLVFFYHTRSGDHFLRARAGDATYAEIVAALGPRTAFVAAYAMTPSAQRALVPSRLAFLPAPSRTLAELVPRHAAQAAAIESDLRLGTPRPVDDELLVAYYFQCPKASSPLLWVEHASADGKRPWRPLFRHVEIPSDGR